MENSKDNFSEWYTEIIDKAELSDRRYPIKGMNVWLPYGLKIMQNIDALIRREMDSRNFKEVSFPLLISREQLEVEFEHVRGFGDQLFWVTKGGSEPLDIELALRPTSESAMYPMFSLWIRTHADLPLRVYQIVNTFRYETKHTRPFIRVREIHFFEAHTAHATYDDAENQLKEYTDVFMKLCETMLISPIAHRRPDWDKFPGARYTIAFDAIMPSGRTLQIGTIHQYGDNFSRHYDIAYADEQGNRNLVSQTTYGMSERLIAALISIHGDNNGLILPPKFAPIQVVIVPIPPVDDIMRAYVEKVKSDLESYGFRVHVDDRDNYTPGYKYNDWEMRGVPVRFEIGNREIRDSSVTAVLRTGGKRKIPASDIGNALSALILEIEEKLRKASSNMNSKFAMKCSKFEDLKKENTVSTAFWCGRKDCSDKIETDADKNCLGFVEGSAKSGKCIVCDEPGKEATFAKTY